MVRIGHGYDLHRLVEGRALVLGGVHIPHSHGLLGHSDADVVLHAVCDAILGALGAGDIGQLVPDSDERFRDVASSTLLKEVVALMTRQGWRVGNLDVTICAERPPLAPYRETMRRRVADLLGVGIEDVNVKAKSNEGVDAVGRGEAIAATAVVVLVEQSTVDSQ